MTGIKSVSLLFEASDAVANEPAALFCAEDENACHLEVYPRSTGEVYICGCGGLGVRRRNAVTARRRFRERR
jgi:hypothetical protein